MSTTPALELASSLRNGLLAWKSEDPHVDRRALSKAIRDNWDRRIGKAKFGGVWSISLAKTNLAHPASTEALKIAREEWSGFTVTVEHAVPIAVLFDAFWAANSDPKLQEVIDAYFVAVVTKSEDERLRKSGLASKMPPNWSWGDDTFARWAIAGISVSTAEQYLKPNHY
ncbi:hypothetical protein [Shimia sp. SDUM112013]|uniref:hypothetical protein n=1 Tax=Shimia sp. SDUM112013 TaxID=3136160 RepID=UPI0032EFD1B4